MPIYRQTSSSCFLYFSGPVNSKTKKGFVHDSDDDYASTATVVINDHDMTTTMMISFITIIVVCCCRPETANKHSHLFY